MPTDRPRRPSYQEPAALEALAERHDPIASLHAAHETAAVLLHQGQASTDPEATQRLVDIVDEVGVPVLAELWAGRPAHSLPGALYRLYLLREWMTSYPDVAARQYADGMARAEVGHLIAHVDPPTPAEVAQVADEILRGAFTGDFADALDRASAFCTVVTSGRLLAADSAGDVDQADRLKQLATDFHACANLWREDKLQ